MQAELITVETSAAHRDAAQALAAPFFDTVGDLAPVACGELPADYKTLLCHAGHMTVTLEAWHESLVDVHVVDEVRRAATAYGRHSLLSRQSDGRVVQSGVMRIDLAGLPPWRSANAIVAGGSPLWGVSSSAATCCARWSCSLCGGSTPAQQLAAELGVRHGRSDLRPHRHGYW